MGVKFSNNAVSSLATALSASDTTITLPASHGAKFPALGAGDWFYLTIVSLSGVMEIVRVTARSGDVLTIVRGQDGTAASVFNPGAVLSHRLNAQAIADALAGAVDQTARNAAAAAQTTANNFNRFRFEL